MSRITTAIVVVLLVGGCAQTPSPNPTTSPVASASPSAAIVPPTASPTTPASVGPAPTDPLPSIPPPPVVGFAMVQVAAGPNHTCGLTDTGGVVCWGANGSGQLGNGTTTDSRTPVAVSGLASGVRAVAVGGSYSCALTSAGAVACWGADLDVQNDTPVVTPRTVPGLGSGVTSISTGFGHACAIVSGRVRCWGAAPGSPTPTYHATPVEIPGLGGSVRAIAAGDGHTCALTSDGGVRCWGNGSYGQLGNGRNLDSAVPVMVAGLTSGVTSIAASGRQTCALREARTVSCWGGDVNISNVPVAVPGVTGAIDAIAVGDRHACVLSTGGNVSCWGSNDFGELGNGRAIASTIPVAVSGLATGVTAISAGAYHTCAVIGEARVTCWGTNADGQLGSILRCVSSSLPLEVGSSSTGSTPTAPPTGTILHATGSLDVVLRFDIDPDHAVSDLAGEQFAPGPEFTLFGDGTVIFRNDLAKLPPAEGPIVRGRPFKIAHLTEAEIQALLRFALVDGGLWNACDRYETRGVVDFAGLSTFTVRAGGLDKVVRDFGIDEPFAALQDRLRNLDRGGAISRKAWVAERYWGVLLDATTWIKVGILPPVSKNGAVAWPWPGVAPSAFAGLEGVSDGRRVFTKAEAAVLGLSKNGGVVQRIYLRGPDGKTIYSFSLWPILPDETP